MKHIGPAGPLFFNLTGQAPQDCGSLRRLSFQVCGYIYQKLKPAPAISMKPGCRTLARS